MNKLLIDVNLKVVKLTQTPQPKDVLKTKFPKNWSKDTSKHQTLKFNKDNLQSGGYIAIPRLSSPSLVVIDFDLASMSEQQKQETLSLINPLLKTTPYAKTTKGYHLYYLLPQDVNSPYHKTKLNLKQGIDIPFAVFLPISDTTKTLHNELKPLTNPPKELTEFLFAKDTNSKSNSHSFDRTYINFGYIQPLLKEINEHNLPPEDTLRNPLLLYRFEEVLFAYNSAIKPDSQLAKHFDEQNITYTKVQPGLKNYQLNRFAFLLLKDPSVDRQTFDYLTTLYNLYLDREPKDKDEHTHIISSLLANHNFEFDINTQRTLTKSITVTHDITQIKFFLLATPEGKYRLLPYLPHSNPETQLFTKTSMQQHLTRDFGIPKQKAKSLLERAPIADLIHDPLQGYGLIPKHLNLHSPVNKFNTAVQTKEMLAFKEQRTDYDQTIVNGYLTLIDNITNYDDYLKDYILSYFKTRYQQPKLRPIIFTLWGIGGSGKDTLISLLSSPFGEHTTLTENMALDKHSIWPTQANVHVSEIADWSKQAQSQLKAQLKAITGSQGTVTIRPLHSQAINVKTFVQIFISMNSITSIHSTPHELRRYVICKSRTTLLKALQQAQHPVPQLETLIDPDNYWHFHAWLSHYTPKYKHNFYSADQTQNSRAFRDYLDLTTTNKDKIIHALNQEPNTNFIHLSTVERICSEVHDTTFAKWLEEQPQGSYKIRKGEILIGRAVANKLLYKENAVPFYSDDSLIFNGNKTPYITIKGELQHDIKPLKDAQPIEVENINID